MMGPGLRGRRLARAMVVGGVVCAAGATMAACGGGSGDNGGGSGSGSGSGEKQLKVALIISGLSNPFNIPAERGAAAAAKKFNVKLTTTGQQGTGSLMPYFQDAVTSQVDGIVVEPGNPTELNGLISQAAAKSIPVGTLILDEPGSKRAFFVGPDALKEGQEQAKRVLETLHGQGFKGTAQATITSCFPGATGQELRRKGFTEEITKHNPYSGDFTVKIVTFLNSTTEQSSNHATYVNLLHAYPHVKVMYPQCAPDTMNAGQVLKAANRKDVIVAGHDLLPKTLDLVEQGWITWTLGEGPYESAYQAVQNIAEHARGKAELMQGTHYSESNLVTKDNVDETRNGPDAIAG